MTIKAFLGYVEIRTKLASVIPFLLGTAYMYYKFHTFDLINGLLMFVSLLLFDMTTTAINNYMDYRTAIKREGYGFEEHNAMVRDNISVRTAKSIIFAMLILAASLGFVLFLRTNIIVLLLGMLSFAIGVCYTFGPLPISRTPFGEIFSGLAMGFIIPFLAVYIHVYESQFIVSSFTGSGIWSLSIDALEIIKLFIVMTPAVMCISNIMLANNICDMEDDNANGRKTFALWVGEKGALNTFAISYVIGYVAIAMTVVFQILPVFYGIGLLSAIVVARHVKIFKNKHIKAETFVLSVKNFMLVNGTCLILLIGCISLGV